MRELNTNDLQRQEAEVQAITHQRLGGFCRYFTDFLNILIRLIYKTPTVKTPRDDKEGYLSQFYYWLYMSVFTFRSCFISLERGYYLEANILSRNLIEVLVKMHYFNQHPDTLKKENEDLSKQETREKRGTHLKTMFDEVFPGYYREYKWTFSHHAHGGVGNLIFKAEIKSATDITLDKGVVYNEIWASFIINNLSVFMLGYIRFYKKLYPEVIANLDKPTSMELGRIEDILLKNFNDHIILKGGENSWHKVSRQIFAS